MLSEKEIAHAKWHARKRIGVGNHLGCAVLSNGLVSHWGHGADKVPECVRTRLADSVACGFNHVIVILKDGSVVGWGGTEKGEAPKDPIFLNGKKAVSVAAGCGFSVAILDGGEVVAWGESASGQCSPPQMGGEPGRRALGVSAGFAHGLAVLDSGSVVGWGSNTDLFGTRVYDQATPPPFDTRLKAVAVSAGAFHSIVLFSNGTILCWGSNEDGQCNSSPLTFSRNIVSISASIVSSLALSASGVIISWGKGSPETTENIPPAIWSWLPDLGLEGFSSIGGSGKEFSRPSAVAVAAGNMFSIAALADGSLIAWGDDSDGRAQPPSHDSLVSRKVPVQPLPVIQYLASKRVNC